MRIYVYQIRSVYVYPALLCDRVIIMRTIYSWCDCIKILYYVTLYSSTYVWNKAPCVETLCGHRESDERCLLLI